MLTIDPVHNKEKATPKRKLPQDLYPNGRLPPKERKKRIEPDKYRVTAPCTTYIGGTHYNLIK